MKLKFKASGKLLDCPDEILFKIFEEVGTLNKGEKHPDLQSILFLSLSNKRLNNISQDDKLSINGKKVSEWKIEVFNEKKKYRRYFFLLASSFLMLPLLVLCVKLIVKNVKK